MKIIVTSLLLILMSTNVLLAGRHMTSEGIYRKYKRDKHTREQMANDPSYDRSGTAIGFGIVIFIGVILALGSVGGNKLNAKAAADRAIALEEAKLASEKAKAERIATIHSKYGVEKGDMILNKQFFLGMTREELLDSAGQPTKKETEVMKTKTKETWIYGNKTSGDVFVFEKDVIVRFKDR